MSQNSQPARFRTVLTARSVAWCLLLAGSWLAGSGCAATSYRYGRFHPREPEGVSREPVVVEYGRPHKTLDRLGWLVGLPDRVFTLNPKTDNHDTSPETIDKLRAYLEQNDISDVYVAVNDYNPKDQWRRLQENHRISPLWRYTAGTANWLGYTLFPNRVFGGDEYIPYTNTLIVSSDVPSLLLAEAAYAKDVRGRRFPGCYAAINDLPVLSLWRHSRATSDVLSYARDQGDWETEQEGYHVLYPEIGSTTFGPASHFVPVAGPFLSAGGALVGHAAGRSVAAVQQPKIISAAPAAPPEPDAASPAEEVADRREPSRDVGRGVVPAVFERPSRP